MKRRILTVAIIAIFSGAALYLSTRPRDRDLLLTAAQVTGPRKWGMHYFWLSDREILTFEKGGSSGVRAVKIDARSGNEATLDKLSATFRGFSPEGEMHLSPDRKSLLWNWSGPGSQPRTRRWGTAISGLDGSLKVDNRPGDNLAWLPDSSGWVRLTNKRGVAYVQVCKLSELRADGIAIGRLTGSPIQSTGIATPFGGFVALGTDRDGRLISSNLPPYLTSTHLAFVYGLNTVHPEQSRNLRSIKLSGQQDFISAALSPLGDRIVWQTYEMSLSPDLPDFILRRLHFIHQKPISNTRIWISNGDGSGMRLLGRLEGAPMPYMRVPTNIVENFAWTPDGKRVSFLYDSKLLTVSVE